MRTSKRLMALAMDPDFIRSVKELQPMGDKVRKAISDSVVAALGEKNMSKKQEEGITIEIDHDNDELRWHAIKKETVDGFVGGMSGSARLDGSNSLIDAGKSIAICMRETLPNDVCVGIGAALMSMWAPRQT